MDNLPFFTEENKDLLYNLCRDEIYKNNQYNIDTNKKYYKTFGEIMKIVYKHSQNLNNLTILNKEVLAKTIPYLQQEIQKKQLRSEAILPPNPLRNRNNINQIPGNRNLPISFRAQDTNIEHENLASVNSNYEKLMSSRDSMFATPKPPPVNFEKPQGAPLGNPNVLMEGKIKNREEINREFNIPDNNSSQLENQFNANVNQGIDSNSVSNMMKTNGIPEERKLKTQDDRVPDLPNVKMDIQDFSLSEQMVRNLHNSDNDDSNIIKDMNTYSTDNDTIDPMVLLNQYQEENKKQDDEYLNIQKSRDTFADRNKEANLNIDLVDQQRGLESQLGEQKFQDSLTYKMNQEMNNINVADLRGQFDHKIQDLNRDDVVNMADDTKALQTNMVYEENKVFNELKDKLFKERKYINKENLVIINSADRDWFNNTSENRYTFKVKFKPDSSRDDQECGVQTIYKNIVSFELVRVLMPVENFIIPYDNRIFVDYKSLPYIVLRIDEIDGLYAGTNSNTHRAFAQLLWDKDHTSEVVTDSTLLANGKTYSRQLKRGFSSMAPMSFEKKTFYPTPLSSLNRLTIGLETPYGKTIKNHNDSLDIKTITYKKFISNEINVPITAVLDSLRTDAAIVDKDNIALLKYYVNNKGVAEKITITTANDYSGKTFVIVGTDTNNSIITENLTGPGGGLTVTSTKDYISIMYISVTDITPGGNVKIGNAGIALNLMNTFEMINNTGFPNNTNRFYIEIETGTNFCNRVFKIGDCIQIKNFTLKSGVTESNVNFKSFMEREEGHYIINLERENLGGNHGYITKMYISPPGDVDTTSATGAMIASSLSSLTTTTIIDDSEGAKLINKSLQTHFVFKVVTREEDIHSHMMSSNV